MFDRLNVVFDGKTPNPGRFLLAVQGDSNAERVRFTLPAVAAGQAASVKWTAQGDATANVVPLVALGGGVWAWPVSSTDTALAQDLRGYVEISAAGSVVWRSEYFHARVSDADDVSLANLPTPIYSLHKRLDGKADVSYVDQKVAAMAGGAPTIFAATVAALPSTGGTGLALVAEDSHLYHWNGTTWADTGAAYPATTLSDGFVTDAMLGADISASKVYLSDVRLGDGGAKWKSGNTSLTFASRTRNGATFINASTTQYGGPITGLIPATAEAVTVRMDVQTANPATANMRLYLFDAAGEASSDIVTMYPIAQNGAFEQTIPASVLAPLTGGYRLCVACWNAASGGVTMTVSDFSVSQSGLPGSLPDALAELSARVGGRVTKSADEVLTPAAIYAVANDADTTRDGLLSARHDMAHVYVDYLTEGENDLRTSGVDRFTIPPDIDWSDNAPTVNGGAVTHDTALTMPLSMGKVPAEARTVTRKSVKASARAGTVRLLAIGDSVTGGSGTDKTYVQYLFERFGREAGAFDDTSRRIMTLGTQKRTAHLVSGNSTMEYDTYHEGRGGWPLYSFLHHHAVMEPTAANYAALGGTGTWTGSDAQKTYIATHDSTFTGTPTNPFFDNAKTGGVKFSIAKWLERYRTHDSSGTALTSGRGTLITASNAANYCVCEPTHVVLMLGHNDFGSNRCPEATYRTNMLAMLAAIRADLPSAKIIMALTPPLIGAWPCNLPLYRDRVGIPAPRGQAWWRNAKYWEDNWSSAVTDANTLLAPTYFVTPTAEAFGSPKFEDGGAGAYTPTTAGAAYHPGDMAHYAWAYQLYSLIKYAANSGVQHGTM